MISSNYGMTEIVDNKIQIHNEEIAALKGQIAALMSRTEMLERTVARYGSVEFKKEERDRIHRLELTLVANALCGGMSASSSRCLPPPWRTSATLNSLG
jgi:hypothetical protein